MKVNLDRIQELIPEACREPPTWDAWLDERYMDDMGIIGHTNPYYKLFYLISQEFKPDFSVELGTYRGVASGHLAAGNMDGKVYTIDWHRDAADKRHQAFAIGMDAHFSNLHYINGCSWDLQVVAQVSDIVVVTPIDILFIDAWHEYQYAIQEWTLYSKLLANEALVICDDIFDASGATVEMKRFWEEVSAGYESFVDTKGHSGIPMGFFRYVH